MRLLDGPASGKVLALERASGEIVHDTTKWREWCQSQAIPTEAAV